MVISKSPAQVILQLVNENKLVTEIHKLVVEGEWLFKETAHFQ